MKTKKIMSSVYVASVLLLFVSCSSDQTPMSPGFGAPGAQKGWFWQNPFPAGVTLIDVDMIDAETLCVVGADGIILTSRDAGVTWRTENSGTNTNLQSVDFVGRAVGFAVGNDGVALRTNDGGAQWEVLELATAKHLRGVSFRDTNRGIIVGDEGLIARTSDGGDSWSVTSGGVDAIQDVHFVNEDIVVAVGDGGKLWLSTNAGEGWSQRSMNTLANMWRIRFVNASLGLAVGFGGVARKTSDGGLSWTKIDPETDEDLTGLVFVDQGTAAIAVSRGELFRSEAPFDTWTMEENLDPDGRRLISVAHAGGNTLVVGDEVVLSNDGTSNVWPRRSRRHNFLPNDVDVVTREAGLVVCDDGVILHTVDGGVNWAERESHTADDLLAVTYIDELTAIVVGRNGFVARTDDGGFTWIPKASLITTDLKAVSFADHDIGMAAGVSTVLRTTDGGDVWESFPFEDGFFTDVFVVNTTLAFVASSQAGQMLRTEDLGDSWDTQFVQIETDQGLVRPAFASLHFASERAGVAVGFDGYILTTSDSGVSWSPVNSHALENGIHLLDVTFVNPASGYAAGARGLILQTIDGGSTWEVQQSHTSRDMGAIAFADDHIGMVVGAGGAILRTTNGGTQ